MQKRLLVVCAAMVLALSSARAQSGPQPATHENLRGLSVPNRNIVWASGTHGTYIKTLDGGRTWKVAQVPGAESLDFRDVEAFNADLAYLLAAGPGDQSRIYKTNDGGRNWSLQFTNKDPKGFFDCMGFWDKDHGIAVGDPVDGKFQLIATDNGGKEWKPISRAKLPPAIDGEGAFAASGTCLIAKYDKYVWFATGGKIARVFRSSDRGRRWAVSDTPIISGEPSQGIFSIAFKNEREGIVVGGDYKNLKSAYNNIASTSDGGVSWKLETVKDSVYLSAATYLERNQILACGPEGSMAVKLGRKEWTKGRVPQCNAAKHIFDREDIQITAGPGGAVSILESNYTDEGGRPEGAQ
jgi:photosystem II stability/assembly factor-like uncharacterized protein